MKINPVLKNESKLATRSIKFTLVLLFYVGFLSLLSINSVAWAISAASIIFSSDIFWFEYLMLLSIVPENNIPFCGTNPIIFLKSLLDISLISTPSIKRFPDVIS